jgi:hypothetical protein
MYDAFVGVVVSIHKEGKPVCRKRRTVHSKAMILE